MIRESPIVSSILTYLDARGILAERVPSGQAFGSYTRKRDNMTKRWRIRGARPGTADILGCLPGGKFLAIEVKHPSGRTDPERAVLQASFRQRVRELGGVAIVVTGVDQVRDALEAACPKV